jgi:exonuclease VII small subunit
MSMNTTSVALDHLNLRLNVVESSYFVGNREENHERAMSEVHATTWQRVQLLEQQVLNLDQTCPEFKQCYESLAKLSTIIHHKKVALKHVQEKVQLIEQKKVAMEGHIQSLQQIQRLEGTIANKDFSS